MSKHLIEEERIYLRDVLLSDANEDYLGWLNDKEVNQYMESRFNSYKLESLKDYVKKMSSDPAYLFLAIIEKKGDNHIGNIKIGPVDENHLLADMGIIIGNKAFWGKGYATEAIKLSTDYAFRELKLHKITAGCYENNIGSMKAFQKAGFEIEGKLRNHYLCNGEYVGKICMGKINPEEKAV